MKTKTGFNIRNVCGQDLIVAEGEENIDFSNIISMNETSSFLWKKVQKMDEFTVDDMVKLLLEEYEVDEDTARNDCKELAAQWAKAGIIEGDDIPVVEISNNNHETPKETETVTEKVKEETPKKGFFGRLFHKK